MTRDRATTIVQALLLAAILANIALLICACTMLVLTLL